MHPIPSFAAVIALATAWIPVAMAAGPVVEAKDGNIVLRSEPGAPKQLTDSGRDSGPVLSPDGKWVVFVRAVPGKTIATGAGDQEAGELWQVGADGKDAIRLVAPKDAEETQDLIATFSDLHFSADGRLVYFITPAWATSGAIHVVDTTNRKERFLLPGNDLEVIHHGDYRDHLLVLQHRYFLGGGSFDWYWLFKPDGTEVGPVGEDTANFNELYAPAEATEERPR